MIENIIDMMFVYGVPVCIVLMMGIAIYTYKTKGIEGLKDLYDLNK